MIPHGVEIFVGLEPIDLRWGFERLSGLVQERIGRHARCGALFVFFGKRCTAMKIIYGDKHGLCLFYKRLDRGKFRFPEALSPNAISIQVDERTLADLLDGIAINTADATLPKRTRMH